MNRTRVPGTIAPRKWRAAKRHPTIYAVQNSVVPHLDAWKDYWKTNNKKDAVTLYGERETLERERTRNLWWRVVSRREIVLYQAPIDKVKP